MSCPKNFYILALKIYSIELNAENTHLHPYYIHTLTSTHMTGRMPQELRWII